MWDAGEGLANTLYDRNTGGGGRQNYQEEQKETHAVWGGTGQKHNTLEDKNTGWILRNK